MYEDYTKVNGVAKYMKKIRFLSINIGNPSLERAQKQCEWLLNREEDVFVLTETKESKGCLYIEEFFKQYGYDLFSFHTSTFYDVEFPHSQTGDLGVMIISKYPITKKNNYFPKDSIYFSRQLEVEIQIENEKLNVVGLYVPSRNRTEEKIFRKRRFIEDIEIYLKRECHEKRIIMGDLNILEKNHKPHYSTFFSWEYDFYDNIIESGYIDAFKYISPYKQEYSWVGRTQDGYRYDYCFVSSSLETDILECQYIHETREIKITDHSAIVMTLNIRDN